MDLHVYHHFDPATLDPRLDQVLSVLRTLQLEIRTMSATMQTAIDALTAQVAAETTVNDSAIALINGFAARLQAAIDAATAAGASPVQTAALDALAASVQTNTNQLSDAVSANTPAA